MRSASIARRSNWPWPRMCVCPAYSSRLRGRIRAASGWLLRFVPDVTAPSAAEIGELRQRVTRLLGASGELVVQQTDLLVPESSGKFRLGYPAKQTTGVAA